MLVHGGARRAQGSACWQMRAWRQTHPEDQAPRPRPRRRLVTNCEHRCTCPLTGAPTKLAGRTSE
eukprot:11169849-Alexandrium_andersonii.AAC.1